MTEYELWRIGLATAQLIATLISPLIVLKIVEKKKDD